MRRFVRPLLAAAALASMLFGAAGHAAVTGEVSSLRQFTINTYDNDGQASLSAWIRTGVDQAGNVVNSVQANGWLYDPSGFRSIPLQALPDGALAIDPLMNTATLNACLVADSGPCISTAIRGARPAVLGLGNIGSLPNAWIDDVAPGAHADTALVSLYRFYATTVGTIGSLSSTSNPTGWGSSSYEYAYVAATIEP